MTEPQETESQETEPQETESREDGPVVPAGRATLVVLIVLGLLAVLRAPAMVHTGEGMRPGITRTLVLGAARPLTRVARPLRLDRPDRWLGLAFGHSATTSATTSELARAARQLPPGSDPRQPRPVPPLRVSTAGNPLRTLITGDSLTEALGPAITSVAGGALWTRTQTRYGTGLVRPDYFDWAAQARTQGAERNLELVIVTMGGNDGQGIALPDGTAVPAGSPGWVAEYQRRVEVVMRIWTGAGRRHLLWLGLPPARSHRLDGYFVQLDAAAAAAAASVPGATYLDLRHWLSREGGYSDYLSADDGRTVLARSRDGVHLTLDGARIAAAHVLDAIRSIADRPR
ncbi:conserved hypothetical protein [Frankia sp. AiPs1]|uniref:DUF459 domain-containing protein n=1 Tax=Frankia sp. AiPa1 TaxID=573492 RepID=UPI00202B642C|nr:DUF459 domain-containing protein [Frankia sp. AiPa1]MCL9758268.1 DUF459 domain-containing protein [Frankia sp. AiPa1]